MVNARGSCAAGAPNPGFRQKISSGGAAPLPRRGANRRGGRHVAGESGAFRWRARRRHAKDGRATPRTPEVFSTRRSGDVAQPLRRSGSVRAAVSWRARSRAAGFAARGRRTRGEPGPLRSCRHGAGRIGRATAARPPPAPASPPGRDARMAQVADMMTKGGPPDGTTAETTRCRGAGAVRAGDWRASRASCRHRDGALSPRGSRRAGP